MANDGFSKIKSSLTRGVTAISMKTSSTLEKAKLRTHIDTLQSEILRLYANLGEQTYTLWQSRAEDLSPMEDLCRMILAKQQEIAQLEAECAAIDERDNQVLGGYQQPQKWNQPYQPVPNSMQQPWNQQPMGEPVGEPVAPPVQDGPVCPSCGTACAPGARFCRGCGVKLTEE